MTFRTGKDEKGAVLVLTSMAMIALLTFSAFAVDIGLRNQYLARDQHAIDAATLAAAYSLNVTGGDLNAASAVVKEVLKENIGITDEMWEDCQNPGKLSSTASDDDLINNTCISFGPGSSGEVISKVRLPEHNVPSVFGGAAGVKTITLSASAAADGANCDPEVDEECSGGGGDATTTTTIAATTTTQKPWSEKCTDGSISQWHLLISYWKICYEYLPGYDTTDFWASICGEDSWANPEQQYNYYWLIHDFWVNGTHVYEGCSTFPGAQDDKDDWAFDTCIPENYEDLSVNYHAWTICHQYFPDRYDDWNTQYNSTTTTSPTTTAPTATTSTTTSTVPSPTSSLDLSF